MSTDTHFHCFCTRNTNGDTCCCQCREVLSQKTNGQHITRLGPAQIEVREYPDGLDEVVARDATVHLEQEDDSAWYLSIRCKGSAVLVHLKAEKGKLIATWNPD